MKRISWTEQAQTDIRALDRATAMRILSGLDRFARSGAGDVKVLQGGAGELRLRIGDHRLFFVYTAEAVIEVRCVRHRREAYRRDR